MSNKIQNSTLQVPFGTGSILGDFSLRQIKPAAAMAALTLNYRSNWDKGRTWWTSTRTLAALTGMSHRHIRGALKEVKGWVTRVKQGVKGSIYQLTHHKCEPEDVPTDKHGNPLKFAMPRGDGAPFEKMFAGEITWKACLIWVLLKVHSDFSTGETKPITMQQLALWSQFGKKTVCDAISELEKAGLLERLSKPHEKSVFQLYPKPPEKRAKQRPEHRKKQKSFLDMRRDEKHCYSFNEKFRLNVDTAEIEERERHGRGLWHPLKDRHRHLVPKAIMRDFEYMIAYVRKFRARLWQALAEDGSDTAHPSSDTAHPSSDTAQVEFLRSLRILL
ncbi:hypothetical protein C6499_09575 [Candidatus Poribacteria bacterium]|nr:MAG: hypothetical protein C6499_09575 [Candidatus Poribacteria bacterium]